MNKLLRSIHTFLLLICLIYIPYLGYAGIIKPKPNAKTLVPTREKSNKGAITISYSGPQSYSQNMAISPLVPSSSGVGSLQYGNPTVYGNGLNQPFGMAEDALGNIYVADGNNSVIQKYPAGGGAPMQMGTGLDFPVGVAVDQFGNLYIADAGNYTIYEIPADGSGQITLSTEDEFSEPSGIAVDAQRNLYITNLGTKQVFMLPAGANSPVVLASGFSSPQGIAVDGAGNVLVIDNGAGALKEIPAGSDNVITLATGFGYPKGVSVDANGFAYVSDAGGSSITRVPVGGGNILKISSGYANPVASILDPSGALYVLEYGNNQVKKAAQIGGFSISPQLPGGLVFDANTGIISGTPTMNSPSTLYTITGYHGASTGTGSVNIAVGSNNSISNNANLNNLVLSSGSLNPVFNPSNLNYTVTVANSVSNFELTPFSADPMATLTVNGIPVKSGSPSVSIALAAGNNTINTLVTAPDGTTTQSYSLTVIRLSNTNLGLSYPTPQVYTVNNSISPLFPVTNGISNLDYGNPQVYATGLYQPFGIAEDYKGNIYVADAGHSQVKSIPAGGGTPQVIGSGFVYPIALATDVSGNLFIADIGTYAITEILSGGNQIRLAANYTFNKPTGIAVDNKGNVYVSNSGTNQVIEIPTGGGNPVVIGSGFNNPQGLAVDGMGNVYVVDNGSGSVKMIAAQGGGITTLASGFGYPKGLILDASGYLYVSDAGGSTISRVPMGGGSPLKVSTMYNSPVGVALDPSGVLYVLEYGSNQVRKANQIGGYSITPALPSFLTLDGNTGIISGTPTAISPATNYTVTGYNINSASNVKANLNIQVISSNKSSIATLSNLTPNLGTISPDFTTGIYAYNESVPNSVSSLTLTPVTTNNLASVRVNGMTVSSGSASPTIPLTIGSNTIYTVVTAQDGITTQSYTLIVTRAESIAPPILSALSISSQSGAGALSPNFSSLVTNYTSSLPYISSTLTVNATAPDPKSSISINGITVGNSNQLNIPLSVGANTIQIVVTAADGITKNNYFILVNRAVSSNVATLSALLPLLNNSNQTPALLNPGFNGGVFTYSIAVPSSTQTIGFNLLSTDPYSSVTVNGQTFTGNPSFPLVKGANIYQIGVTAEDGITTKTYSVTVNRAPSSDATLSSFIYSTVYGSFSKGPNPPPVTIDLTSANSKSTPFVDTLYVPSFIIAINLDPIPTNPAAKITGTSSTNRFSLGLNTYTYTVTAEDGVTQKVYTIVVIRESSGYSDIGSLTFSSGKLTPAFNSIPYNYSYTDTVPYSVSTIDINAIAASIDGAIGFSANNVISHNAVPGTASATIGLSTGSNIVGISCYMGFKDINYETDYTVNIVRSKPSSDASLSALLLATPNVDYSIAVTGNLLTDSLPYAAKGISVFATPSNNGASFTVNGVAVANGSGSTTIPLNLGSNTLVIVVTAQDGITTQTYTITLNRAKSGSSVSTLSSLILSTQSGALALNPGFSPNNTTYTDSVPFIGSNLFINASTTDPNASLTINGVPFIAGTGFNVPLNIGRNTVLIVVTASDGLTQKTYTLNVNRTVPSTDAFLTNIFPIVNNGLGVQSFTPNFNTAVFNYNTTVPFSANTLSFSLIPKDPNSSITINGITSITNPAFALNIGNNSFQIVVTAQDGITTNTYTVNVLKLQKGTGLLTNITSNWGIIQPGISQNISSYTDSVPAGTREIAFKVYTSDPSVTVYLNGGLNIKPSNNEVGSGLNIGNNLIVFTAVSKDGSATQTDSINVFVRDQKNIALSNLNVSVGQLSPAFSGSVLSYTDSVPNSADSVSFNPVWSSPNIKVLIQKNASFYSSPQIPYLVGQKILLDPGSNWFTITLINNSGGISTELVTYNVYVVRYSNYLLSNLTTSAGTLIPSFSSTNYSYSQNVDFNTSSITLTGTTQAPGNFWEESKTNNIFFNQMPSGVASPSIPLDTGNNSIIVAVLSPSTPGTLVNGYRSEGYAYTLTIHRASAPKNPIFLNGLTLFTKPGDSIQNYTPGNFSSQNTTYFTSVFNSTSYVLIRPFLMDTTKGMIQINGATYNPSTKLYYYPLLIGANPIKISVTNKDGSSSMVYTVTVTRLGISHDANLQTFLPESPSVKGVVPKINFDPNVTNYSIEFPYSLEAFTEFTLPEDTNATVSINGTVVKYFSYSGYWGYSYPPYVQLKVGLNIIPVTVTAQDGITQKTYTFRVTRDSASKNANLLSLSLQNGAVPISPNFQSNLVDYSAKVPFTTNQVNLNLSPADSNATITVNGFNFGYIVTNYIFDGSTYNLFVPQLNFNLNVGDNEIQILVKAQDGITQKTYTVHIIRASGNSPSNSGGSDATLSSLSFTQSAGNPTLSPNFVSQDTVYTATVDASLNETQVYPTPTDSNATVLMNGVILKNTPSVFLGVGNTTLKIQVIAADGITSKTYTIHINRPANTIPYLKSILVGGDFFNFYGSGTFYYPNKFPDSLNITVHVPYSESSGSLYATFADPGFTYELVNGNLVTGGYQLTDFYVGANKYAMDVYSGNGINHTLYNLTIVRDQAPTVATLSNIAITGSKLNPGFTSGNHTYIDSVASGTSGVYVYPFKTDSLSTVSLNGLSVGNAGYYLYVPLNVGPNVLNFVVTAQDGVTTQTYTVDVIVPGNVSQGPNQTLAVNRFKQSASFSDPDSTASSPDGIYVHPGVSPNGDGMNDFLSIDDINNYPENHLVIVNRSGVKVYEANGYSSSNPFNGHTNTGSLVPAGTYFYVLDYTDGNTRKRKSGYIILKY